MILISFFLRNICQNGISVMINDIHKIDEPITSEIKETHKETNKNKTTEENMEKSMDNSPLKYFPMTSLGRKNYDVTSGRITLFWQGIEIFKKHPIFGIGRENLILYGEKYLEDGIMFSDLHNGYLTILVSYGMVGFIIFIVFAILVAREMYKFLFKLQKNTNKNFFRLYSEFFSIVVAYSLYSVFEKAIFSEITIMVVFFWLVLGYAESYMTHFNDTLCS
ncbi:hypothetical protein FACS189465_1710 [Clostridia bacterium]|nr:hypothetical protein FACS189465_1710 [Clostridia bacterium]